MESSREVLTKLMYKPSRAEFLERSVGKPESERAPRGHAQKRIGGWIASSRMILMSMEQWAGDLGRGEMLGVRRLCFRSLLCQLHAQEDLQDSYSFVITRFSVGH